MSWRIAQPRGPVAARADADGLVLAPDLQRLVPVARADAPDRGEAASGRWRARLAFGFVRSLQPLEMLPVSPCRDVASTPGDGDRDERERDEQRRRRDAGGASAPGARSASAKSRRGRRQQHDEHRHDEDPEVVAGRRRAGRGGRGPG